MQDEDRGVADGRVLGLDSILSNRDAPKRTDIVIPAFTTDPDEQARFPLLFPGKPRNWERVGETPWCKLTYASGNVQFYHMRSGLKTYSVPSQIMHLIPDAGFQLSQSDVQELFDQQTEEWLAAHGAVPDSVSDEEEDDAAGPPGEALVAPGMEGSAGRGVAAEAEEPQAEPPAETTPDEAEPLEPVVPEEVPVLPMEAPPAPGAEDDAAPQLSKEQLHANFCALLAESSLTPFSSWDKEQPRMADDPRCAGVEPSERRKLFSDYVAGIAMARRASTSGDKQGAVADLAAKVDRAAVLADEGTLGDAQALYGVVEKTVPGFASFVTALGRRQVRAVIGERAGRLAAHRASWEREHGAYLRDRHDLPWAAVESRLQRRGALDSSLPASVAESVWKRLKKKVAETEAAAGEGRRRSEARRGFASRSSRADGKRDRQGRGREDADAAAERPPAEAKEWRPLFEALDAGGVDVFVSSRRLERTARKVAEKAAGALRSRDLEAALRRYGSDRRRRARLGFTALLQEKAAQAQTAAAGQLPGVGLDSRWSEDTRALLRGEARYAALADREERARVFDAWRAGARAEARAQLQRLLKETTEIEFSRGEIEVDEVVRIVRRDPRCAAMDAVPELRKSIVSEFLRDVRRSKRAGEPDRDRRRERDRPGRAAGRGLPRGSGNIDSTTAAGSAAGGNALLTRGTYANRVSAGASQEEPALKRARLLRAREAGAVEDDVME